MSNEVKGPSGPQYGITVCPLEITVCLALKDPLDDKRGRESYIIYPYRSRKKKNSAIHIYIFFIYNVLFLILNYPIK